MKDHSLMGTALLRPLLCSMNCVFAPCRPVALAIMQVRQQSAQLTLAEPHVQHGKRTLPAPGAPLSHTISWGQMKSYRDTGTPD